MWCNNHENKRVFNRLVKESEKAFMFQSSLHAAAVVWRGKILAIGYSKDKSHPMMVKYQPNPDRIYLHAEVDAIVKTVNRYGSDILQDCAMYVLRTTKSGKVGDSKPCDGCEAAIKAFGIRHVYWS